jgi:hypothetical protein
MDNRDEARGAEAARDAAAEGAADEHPARPEQTDKGFETGYDQERDTPEEKLEPNFARGTAHEELPEEHRHGHFSTGEEQTPDAPEEHVERRFSEGTERSPTSE